MSPLADARAEFLAEQGLTVRISNRLIRLLGPVLSLLTQSPLGRTVLLARLSAKQWRVRAGATLCGHFPQWDSSRDRPADPCEHRPLKDVPCVAPEWLRV